jgi:cytochrome d ubiquinol oxidase subunit II
MTTLQILWFVAIAVLWIGFFFLEGFDFGVGMQFFGIAKDEEERDALYESIGPHWDANEVWMISAGGAMFASYPGWYASLFSGFYLLLLLILLGLIYRGVAFEFREQMETLAGARIWGRLIAIASFIVPFLFGMIFTAVVTGIPLDAKGDVSAGFFDYVRPMTIIGGIALVLLSYVHGLNFTMLKQENQSLVGRAHAQLKRLYPVLLVGEVIFAAALLFYSDFLTTKPVATLSLLALAVGATLISWHQSMAHREGVSFFFSGLTIISVVSLLFVGLFPRVMVDSAGVHDLLATAASASPYTLEIMTFVTAFALPLTVGYQIWSFYVFRERIAHHGHDDNYTLDED